MYYYKTHGIITSNKYSNLTLTVKVMCLLTLTNTKQHNSTNGGHNNGGDPQVLEGSN